MYFRLTQRIFLRVIFLSEFIFMQIFYIHMKLFALKPNNFFKGKKSELKYFFKRLNFVH